MQRTSSTWNQESKTGGLPRGLTARDGESIAGESGRLRIALSTRGLRLQPGETAPTHWLLPLNDAEVVRLSANLPGELLWLSPRRPQSLAGRLVGDFQGAWWENGFAMVKFGDDVEEYFVPTETPNAGSLALLAAIVALRWSGRSSKQILSALASAVPASRSVKSTSFNRTFELAVA